MKEKNEFLNILDIVEEIKEDEVVELLKRLIEIESHKNIENQELDINKYIEEYFKSLGVKTKMDFVYENRPNLYASIGKGKKGKNLMLTGHIDTVPPYNMVSPFNPEIKNNTIFGRGSVDMKGAIAAMMIAFKVIHESNLDLEGKLFFASVIDEEQRCQGTKHMIENYNIDSDYAIVGEPTNLDIMIGHKGMEWLEINVIGESGHGSKPNNGVNSIYKAMKLVDELKEYFACELPKRTHTNLGEPTMNIGLIKGGEDPNTIPGRTIIQIDRRWVPGETTETMLRDIEIVIDKIKRKDSNFRATVRRMDEATGYHPPLNTQKDENIVTILSESGKELFDKEVNIGYFDGWSDAAPLSKANIKSVVLGPGELNYAHSNNEQIEIKQVVKAAQYYALIALNICL